MSTARLQVQADRPPQFPSRTSGNNTVSKTGPGYVARRPQPPLPGTTGTRWANPQRCPEAQVAESPGHPDTDSLCDASPPRPTWAECVTSENRVRP